MPGTALREPCDDRLLLEIGRRLRVARRLRGYSKKTVAVRSGVSESSVANLELGVRDCYTSRLYRVAGVLGLEMGDLFVELQDVSDPLFRGAWMEVKS